MSSRQKIIYLTVILAVLFFAGAVQAAWRDAPVGPPNYGASPYTQADYKPVNLGSSPQAKLGGFTIGTSTPLSTDMLQIESPTANAGIVFSRGGTVVGGILANTVNQLDIQSFNQPIRFSTNGFTNEHMRVATNGNVGIEAEAPSARLAIGDTGSPGDTIAAYANSSQSTLYAEQLGSGYAIYASGGLNYFSGNVGIGTTDPQGYKLYINDTGSNGLAINAPTNAVLRFKQGGADQWGFLANYPDSGKFSLYDYDVTNGSGIRLTVDQSGNMTVGGTLNAGTLQQGGTAVCLSTGVNCQVAGAPTWTSITGKPTTVVGYGITDMGSQSVNYANSAGSATWSSITGKPTTVVGYGITDMGSQSVNYANSAGGVAWSNITSRPSGLDDGDDVGTNYVSGLIAGTGVTISGAASNGWTPRIDVAVSEADTLQTVTNRGKTTTQDITAVAFYVSSDARLKKNVETLSGALEKLGRARGVSYDLASGQGARQIGVIAQELEQEFPELVITDGNNYKAVAYDRLSAVLIEAIKELKAQNQALQSRLDHLEKKW